MIHPRTALVTVLGLTVLGLLGMSSAWGEAVVLSSTAPGMSVGRVLADDERVRLPETTLTTLLLADGRMLKLNGPVEGRVGDLGGGQQSAALPGGGFGGVDVSALGGTRGELASAPPLPALDSVAVDIRHPGTWCVSPAGTVMAEGDGVVESAGTGKPPVAVQAGKPWPAELPVTDGARYVVHGAAGPVPIGFRVVRAEAGGDTAFGLARAGCLAQVGPYLREAGRRTTAFALYLTTDRGQAPRYAIGESVTVSMQTNRPARLACLLAKDDAITPVFPDWVELADHQELQVPGDRVANEVAATPPPGVGELRCRAVDKAAAGTLPPVARMDELALPDGSVASAHLFIRVQ